MEGLVEETMVLEQEKAELAAENLDLMKENEELKEIIEVQCDDFDSGAKIQALCEENDDLQR